MATKKPPRIYPGCTAIRVIDGDTVVVRVDLGFYLSAEQVKVRLNGINCAELGKPNAEEARRKTEDFLLTQPKWTLVSFGQDKYGRWLGDFESESSERLTQILLAAGLAKPYPK